jgi:hypothetical protein
MNIFFNDKQIKISALDSEQTIKEKISIELNTLPKYLHFPSSFSEFKNNDRYEVEDLLNTIKQYVSNALNYSHTSEYFSNFFNDSISSKIKKYNLLKDIVRPFIIYNAKYIELLNDFKKNNNEMFIPTILDSLFQSLNAMNIVYSEENLSDLLINYKKERKEFEKEIAEFKSKETDNNDINSYISRLSGIDHTDFILEENILNLKLDIPNTISLLDLFNFIELNPIVKFASLKKNGFYKIFSDFVPPEHWVKKDGSIDDDFISFYVQKERIINRQRKQESEEQQKQEQEERGGEDYDYDEEDDEDEEQEDSDRNKQEKNYKDVKLLEKQIKQKQREFDINYVKVTIDEMFNVVFDFNINSTSKEYLMNAFFNLFPKHDIPIESESCSLIRGVYDFPNKNLNKTVLCDLIMTNPTFSKFISINESKGIPMSKTTIRFNHESTGEIKASLIEQKNDKYKNLKKSDEYFSENSYIQVHIQKCKNIESVRNFQFILSRLLEVYYKEFDNISKIYRLYIKGFKDVTKEKKNITKSEVKSKLLENIEPKIFTKGQYIRSICQKYPVNIDDDYNAYQENILNGTEVDESNMYKHSIENNQDILIFPSKELKGFQPRRYICDSERNRQNKHIYPGLKENKFFKKGNDIFKYLPCCFPVSQRKKLLEAKKEDPVIANFYLFEGDDVSADNQLMIIEEAEEKKEDENNDTEFVKNKNAEAIKSELSKHQQDKIKTNKFVKEFCSGMLPPKLNILFENLQTNEGYAFYRFGVKKSANSFIDCIQTIKSLSPTNEDNKFWLYTEDLRRMFSRYSSLSKQENYDKTIRDIKKEIKDVKSYFNPLQYVRILEEYYKYNIFLFIRNDDSTEYMSLPHHKDGYYKTNKKHKCVFIYIHGGSESDITDYPQCEIIALSNNKKTNDVQCEFDYESEIAQKIIYIYNRLDNINYLDENDDDNLNKLNPVSQYVDEFGKTRVLNFKQNDDKTISLFLKKPISPRDLPIDNNFYLIDDNNAVNDVISYLNLQNLSQKIIKKDDKSKMTELNGKFGSLDTMVYFRNYTIPNVKIKDEKFSLTIGFNDENYLGLFKLNKKIASYISEYFIWFYSNYIYEQQELNPLLNVEVVDQDLLNNFIDAKILIDDAFSYYDFELINRFSLRTSEFVKDGKLVLNSEEMLKRLIYNLRIEINRNFHTVMNYRNHTFLQNFYSDTDDFEQYANQIILKDEKFTLEWIFSKQNSDDVQKYVIYDSIYPSLIQPYFFKNDLVDNSQTYLAQNTNSFKNAMKIAVDWIEKKYNVGYYVEEEDGDSRNYNFNLFSYVNSDEIKKYIVNTNHPNNYKISIIGYKIDGDSYFTTLLSI